MSSSTQWALLVVLLLRMLSNTTAAEVGSCQSQPASCSTTAQSTSSLLHRLSEQQQSQLVKTAQLLMAPGKGILAADESIGTMGKRFQQVGISNTVQSRAAWRKALLTTPDLHRYISGVILTEETLVQPLHNAATSTTKLLTGTGSSSSSSSSSGGSGPAAATAPPRLVDQLTSRGVALGIKVDQGTTPLNPEANPDSLTESSTRGLEGLMGRCQRYAAAGASFSKWRAVLHINETLGWPSQAAVSVNAEQLAEFAAVSQAAGLVPMVEPEVLVSEGTHGLAASESVSQQVLAAVVRAMQDKGVLLEAVILKPAMILPGSSSGGSSSVTAEDVAAATLRVLRRTLPPAVAGVAFLSGGQSTETAAAHLAAINQLQLQQQQQPLLRQQCVPWALTFSFGRALQAHALQTWSAAAAAAAAADPDDEPVQEAFIQAAAVTALALGAVEP